MANWTNIDVNSLLPGQPFTSAIALAYEENPRAIADQATSAPKIADKTVLGSGGTITFTGLDDYAGIFIKGGFESATQGLGALILNIQYNDGSGLSGASDFANIATGSNSTNTNGFFELFVDFATGVVKSAGFSVVGGPFGRKFTMGGASIDITDIRLSGPAATTSFWLLAIPQGGESAS